MTGAPGMEMFSQCSIRSAGCPAGKAKSAQLADGIGVAQRDASLGKHVAALEAQQQNSGITLG